MTAKVVMTAAKPKYLIYAQKTKLEVGLTLPVQASGVTNTVRLRGIGRKYF